MMTVVVSEKVWKRVETNNAEYGKGYPACFRSLGMGAYVVGG